MDCCASPAAPSTGPAASSCPAVAPRRADCSAHLHLLRLLLFLLSCLPCPSPPEGPPAPPLGCGQGELESFLVEITARIFGVKDDAGEGQLIDKVLDKTGMKVRGRTLNP